MVNKIPSKKLMKLYGLRCYLVQDHEQDDDNMTTVQELWGVVMDIIEIMIQEQEKKEKLNYSHAK